MHIVQGFVGKMVLGDPPPFMILETPCVTDFLLNFKVVKYAQFMILKTPCVTNFLKSS